MTTIIQHFPGYEIEEVEEDSAQRQKLKIGHNSLHDIFLSLTFHSKSNRIQDKVIHFVLPLFGRQEVLERFLRNYEEVCLLPKENTELHVVLFPQSNDPSGASSMEIIQSMKNKHRNSGIDVISASGNFSRARALDLGASRLKDDDLLFFVDVDIVFTASALQRIRFNTVMNRRIYFPIVYSQYDPKIVHPEGKGASFAINDDNGYWRQFGFGIVSLYKRDFVAVGGFNLSIKGWGKEDVDLFEKAVKSNLEVFRSPDKNLIHVYHDVDCDNELSTTQLSMCRGTKADTFAGTRQLANLIYQNPEYLEFAKTRRLRNRTSGE